MQAPELFKVGESTKKADELAFGVTMWELLTAKVPFDGLSDAQIWAEAKDGRHSKHLLVSDVKEKKAAVLIEMCLLSGRSHSSLLSISLLSSTCNYLGVGDHARVELI